MDTRLVELLPRALNVKNGDIKLIKNAGALVTHPFGSIMRSLLVAVYELQADEVLIIGHHDCGMSGMKPDGIMEHMRKRGKSEAALDTISSEMIYCEESLFCTAVIPFISQSEDTSYFAQWEEINQLTRSQLAAISELDVLSEGKLFYQIAEMLPDGATLFVGA